MYPSFQPPTLMTLHRIYRLFLAMTLLLALLPLATQARQQAIRFTPDDAALDELLFHMSRPGFEEADLAASARYQQATPKQRRKLSRLRRNLQKHADAFVQPLSAKDIARLNAAPKRALEPAAIGNGTLMTIGLVTAGGGVLVAILGAGALGILLVLAGLGLIIWALVR